MKRRWWQTRRLAAEQHARTCQEALVELHEFVEAELDPQPAPWEAYHVSRRHQVLARSLQEQAQHDLYSDSP